MTLQWVSIGMLLNFKSVTLFKGGTNMQRYHNMVKVKWAMAAFICFLFAALIGGLFYIRNSSGF